MKENKIKLYKYIQKAERTICASASSCVPYCMIPCGDSYDANKRNHEPAYDRN